MGIVRNKPKSVKPAPKRIGHTIQTFRISFSARRKLHRIMKKLMDQGEKVVSISELIRIAMRYTWGVDILDDSSDDL